MRVFLILTAFLALAVPAQAEPFASYGPIDCSGPPELTWTYVNGKSEKALHLRYTTTNGAVRTFVGTGDTKEIPYRPLPKSASMSFGPKGIVACTSKQYEHIICQSYEMKRGWGGSCQYCLFDAKSNTDKCYRGWGQVVETTRSRTEAVALPR